MYGFQGAAGVLFEDCPDDAIKVPIEFLHRYEQPEIGQMVRAAFPLDSIQNLNIFGEKAVDLGESGSISNDEDVNSDSIVDTDETSFVQGGGNQQRRGGRRGGRRGRSQNNTKPDQDKKFSASAHLQPSPQLILNLHETVSLTENHPFEAHPVLLSTTPIKQSRSLESPPVEKEHPPAGSSATGPPGDRHAKRKEQKAAAARPRHRLQSEAAKRSSGDPLGKRGQIRGGRQRRNSDAAARSSSVKEIQYPKPRPQACS